LNRVAVHSYDDSSSSSPSTPAMLTTTTTTTTTTTKSENLGRPQIKRPTSLNVSKPTGRFKKKTTYK